MKKVIILGLIEDRESVLETLQNVGIVHLEPFQIRKENINELIKKQREVQKTIDILQDYPPETPIESVEKDISEIIHHIFEEHTILQTKSATLAELSEKIQELEKWSHFSTEYLEKFKNHNIYFQFWECSSYKKFPKENVFWQGKEGNFYRFVTASETPLEINDNYTKEVYFKKGTVELQKEYDELYRQKQEHESFLKKNTIYLESLKQHAKKLGEQIVVEEARSGLLEHHEIFGLQGWFPKKDIPHLENAFQNKKIFLQFVDPDENETPPTLIQNPKWIQSILDVIKIYAIPGYSEWDPSASVYFSFAVFFAMIIGDAGYGAIILSILLYFRKKMMQFDIGARIFRLGVTVSVSCILYGAFTGSWFALDLANISPDSPFSFLRYITYLSFIPTNDSTFMMIFSIYLGVIHLTVARLIQILRFWGSSVILAEIGWILGMWGGMLYLHLGNPIAPYLFFTGLGLIVLFTSNSKNIFKRLIAGLLGLTGISQTFADILSYLRLFALGLSGAVMASVFNNLGQQIQESIPGIVGYILMIFVVFSGHTINLGLSIMSGVIHGLRLNFLEFYRYCFEGTGYTYKPFCVKK